MDKNKRNRAVITDIVEPNPDRQSWYGKCLVYMDERGELALRSYSTIVMTRDSKGNLHRHWDGWSATTARHIRAAFGVGTLEYRKMEVENLPLKWRYLQACLCAAAWY